MKRSTIYGYMCGYAQWGYRALDPDGTARPFDPARARKTQTLVRTDEEGTSTYLEFWDGFISLTQVDCMGRLKIFPNLHYPSLYSRYVSPMDCGAKCDGITDDTAAMQMSINSAAYLKEDL